MANVKKLSNEEKAEFAVPLWDLLMPMAASGAQSKGKAYTNALKTYTEVSDLLKVKAPSWDCGYREVGQVLLPIQEYCKSKNLPFLTGLVINARTGRPGSGYAGNPDTWEEDAQKVCDYSWDEKHPDNPGYEEFLQYAG